MQKTFLYRLFKYSKPGFIVVVLFILCYAVFFTKKIDATFFPYNGMFAMDFNKDHKVTAYLIKLNGMPVKITGHLYWKKDFLEESLINFAKYKKNNDVVFMDNYIRARIHNNSLKNFLSQKLVPSKQAMDQWLSWYAGFAGDHVSPGAVIELMQYDFIYEHNAAIVTDSAGIYKITTL